MRHMTKIKSTRHDANQEENNADEANEGVIEDENAAVPAKEFNYLLNMPMWSLTYEKVEALIAEHDKKNSELQDVADTPIEVMYNRDLDKFLALYE